MDLFNNLQNIVITNADENVWKQMGKVNFPAARGGTTAMDAESKRPAMPPKPAGVKVRRCACDGSSCESGCGS